MFRTYFHFASFAPKLLTKSKASDVYSFVSKTNNNLKNYHFEVVRSLRAFEALESDWNSLFTRCPNKHQPFQSFGWHKQWCKTYLSLDEHSNKEAPLHIITLWKYNPRNDNHSLVMLWPMQLKTFLGRNHLHFMGDPVSQYGDILLDEHEDSAEILAQTWHYIQEKLDIDLLVLRKVKRDACIFPLLQDLKATCTESEQGHFIDLNAYEDYTQYQQRFKAKERKNRKRKYRRLQEQGPVTISFLTSGVEASYFARQAILLKQKWLEQKGLISKAFQNKKLAIFFAEIAQSSDKNININLSVLHVGNKPAAITISFGTHAYRAMHINVIDLAFEKNSPGVALLEETIKNSINNKDEVLDFLAPSDPYKNIWCDQTLNVEDYSLSTNTAGDLYTKVILKWVRHGGKTLLKTMPSPVRHNVSRMIAALIWKVKK